MALYVAIFALVLAYLAVVAAYLALRTLAKVRRATAALTRGADGSESLIEASGHTAEQVESLTEQAETLVGRVETLTVQFEALSGQVGQLRATLEHQATESATAGESGLGALRNVALVRYDASSELSGRLSFSLALLDEKGDGVTISALAGSADTRITAKGVTAGSSADDHELSREERRAVSAAVNGPRTGLLGRQAS
jgi:TolA-binding protein